MLDVVFYLNDSSKLAIENFTRSLDITNVLASYVKDRYKDCYNYEMIYNYNQSYTVPCAF